MKVVEMVGKERFKYSMESREVTRTGERTAFISPARPYYLVQELGFLPCLFGFEPWCWITKYADPTILFDIKGVKVDDIHIYVLTGEVEGKIITKFLNRSEEGETYQENVKTGEIRNRRKVRGSADLRGKFDEYINLREIDEILAEINDRVIEETRPEVEIEIESSFEKSGYWETLKAIYDVLVTGRMYVDDTIKVDVRYSWRGQTKKISEDINIRAWLPVGDVHWHAW